MMGCVAGQSSLKELAAATFETLNGRKPGPTYTHLDSPALMDRSPYLLRILDLFVI